MNRFIVFIFGGILLVSLIGCSTTKVERVDVDKKIDLSGNWNDYDATITSQEMIQDCLDKPWLHEFVKNNGRNPTIIVGHVANRTYEHINTQVVTKNVEQELLNSGKVVFVASSEERQDIRAEREDQKQGFTDPATIAQVGKERGADYMMIGSVNSIKDEVKGKAAIYYQVNLELIDLSTNTKVWLGQKEIKKSVKKSRFSL
jgi:uncharacterized protein (TIGR02722 family)